MPLLILVASDEGCPIQHTHLLEVEQIFPGSEPCRVVTGKVVELTLERQPGAEERVALEKVLTGDRIDCFFLSEGASRRKKMLICDMDSTVVEEETLDELAASVGLKEEIAAITARSMAGEIDFRESLYQRVAMLKGMPESAISEKIARLSYMKGARKLVHTMAASGAHCILVSGGFTCFTGPVAKSLGFQRHHGNIMEFENGLATGRVREPILNRNAKRDFLEHYQRLFGLQKEDILAVGDGANDLEMLRAAGLGVGFHPKDFLRRRVDHSILYGDLTTLLYLQGFKESEIKE